MTVNTCSGEDYSKGGGTVVEVTKRISVASAGLISLSTSFLSLGGISPKNYWPSVWSLCQHFCLLVIKGGRTMFDELLVVD